VASSEVKAPPGLEGAVEYPGWGPYLDQFAGLLKDELMKIGLAPIEEGGPGKYNWKLSAGIFSKGKIMLTSLNDSLYYRIDISRDGALICLGFLLGIIPGIIFLIIGGQNADKSKAQTRTAFENAEKRIRGLS